MVMVPYKYLSSFGLLILISTFLVSFYLLTNVKRLEDFSYYNKPSFLMNQTKNGKTCEELYDIATKMLNGSPIELPFDTNHTQWTFYKGIGANLFNESLYIWNSKRIISKKIRKAIKLYNRTTSNNIIFKKHFITFAHSCCERSRLKAVMRAVYPGGFDTTKIHDLSSLSAGFQRKHSDILKHRRGSGYWLWKPYIILKTLIENMSHGDLLMYQDAGAYLINDAGPLLKLCENTKYGILIFYITLFEQFYTKRDAFIVMNMDNNHIHQSFQRLASFILFQKNCKSVQFVMEWLAYASDPRLITDMENTLGKGNLPRFREHRHDQSVLSLLSKKWGVVAYRTPSQYGNSLGFLAGPYGQMIVHNRDRS